MIEMFRNAAEGAGAVLFDCEDVAQAVDLINEKAGGPILLPASSSCKRSDLPGLLADAGAELHPIERNAAAGSVAGVTSACFGIADTGTLVLDSTPEDIRLASTLPTRHFVLLDKSKIISDGLAAVEPLRRMHQLQPRNYIAYITGPSRTADIERVLTIGVHGPKELYILLIEKWSSDLLEM